MQKCHRCYLRTAVPLPPQRPAATAAAFRAMTVGPGSARADQAHRHPQEGGGLHRGLRHGWASNGPWRPQPIFLQTAETISAKFVVQQCGSARAGLHIGSWK